MTDPGQQADREGRRYRQDGTPSLTNGLVPVKNKKTTMKTVGIIGGIGPESTIEYYRFIIEGYRKRRTEGSYPSIIINSVDLSRLITWMNAGELDAAADYLSVEIEKLARAGVDFAVLASNTPHIV